MVRWWLLVHCGPVQRLSAHCTVLFRSETYFVKSNDNEKPGLVVSFLCLL
jgi:hypothetical protein